MRRSVILLAGAAAISSPALASVDNTEWPDETRLYLENDVFNLFTEQTDRYYTQGLRIEWLGHDRPSDARFLPGISHADWCSLLCGDGAESGRVDSGYAFGQNMYTPEEITIAAPQPFDRPWAGYLYGSRIARVSYEEGSLQRQDRIEVSVGIVGPASLAGATQIQWHDWFFPRRPPSGWDNQLRNEPILQLRYEAAWRWPGEEGGNFDLIPRARLNVGNALISLEAEVTARIGWNLSGFGAPGPQPLSAEFSGTAGSGDGWAGPGWPASFNLFARVALKAVAHNITLDGNTFASNDIRIDRTPLVPEIAAGLEANLFGNFWVTFQFVHRGSEFESWGGRSAPAQQFGAITLAIRPAG